MIAYNYLINRIITWSEAKKLALLNLLKAEERRRKYNQKEATIPPHYDGMSIKEDG